MVGLLLSARAQSIAGIQSDDYLEKELRVRRTVKNTMKLGSLPGYTLKDKQDNSIGLASKTLPAKESTKTVKGTVSKSHVLGSYYVQTNE